ncbi:MAG: CPBP family intramembrane metalloprotease [Acidobacteria bacterium]|nr:CPBP family intramembrane metalloprotease [Acidobacteriota bacterium]
MKPSAILINPNTGLLRSGWRVVVYISLSPHVLIPFLTQETTPDNTRPISADSARIFFYLVSIVWTLGVSWLCLRLFDRLNIFSLGFTFHRGWLREISLGCALGAMMIIAVVGLQVIGGGTSLAPNPIWWKMGTIEWPGLLRMTLDGLALLVFIALAATFEELNYRGYPFQSLVRAAGPMLPVLLFSLLFAFAHLDNPNKTLFSIVNTVLAGIWLALAYLKTRSLWFPTALHFTWNWMLGAFFGLPVSGLVFSHQTVLISTSENPLWLTGGSYGCEGGAAATIVLLIATVIIWRAKWLSVSPDLGRESGRVGEGSVEKNSS